MKLKNVVVQIPCLNEEEGIGQVIKQIKKENSNFRIIVYDNGSIDKSVDIVKKNNVEVRHVRKKGKGNVVRQMFSEQIDADYYIMVDGDNTYDISNINFMLNSMIKYNYDMIVGKRIHTNSLAYRKGHVLGNKFFSFFVSLFFGKDITDIFSGFRVFSKRFVKTFPLISQEFEIESELTIHAMEQKLAVAEIDCKYRPRVDGSFSKLNTIKDGTKILKLILILIKDEKPLLFFSITSFIFFIFSLVVGLPVIRDYYLTGLVERIPSAILAGVLMIISVLSFFSGLILDIIKKVRFENKRMNFLLYKD